MANLSKLIRSDAISQLISGIALLCVGLVLLAFGAIYTFELELFIFILPSFIGGWIFVVNGVQDFEIAKNTKLRLKDAEESTTKTTWPSRMFLQWKMNHSFHLLDMKELEYLSFIEAEKTGYDRFLSLIMGFTSMRSFLPLKQKLVDDKGNTLFYIHRKGTILKWRSYVYDSNGKCIAIVEKPKMKNDGDLQYLDSSGVRWIANKDGIGFFTVSDVEGISKVVMKPGAIPVESEELSKSNGILMEWHEQTDIPYSLLVFIGCISIRYFHG
ncbi:hypothetical protein NC661_14890 [Aquibacillus koreensis]|uniref:Uncharacterized protein n=1 Tax=Aquibacillus koreensis TaxID=279446 RepID=A0A9X4AIZ0_9BACI|nr:hypothetical protein [Aquibacillus koreensis]MCT2537310.1 hypothetical protein [Aquibacillus koreensis]MDC3421657.1 hypothetical protein [Aquibacillus koreensis]